ncbi:MAG: hypothetical protein K1X71_16780 [Pirellulales bacterium]|nr:hypothetical protein [Pirellulales bacterium]
MSKTLIPLLVAGCLTIFGEAAFARGRGCYCYAPCCPPVAVAAAPVAPAPAPAPSAAPGVAQAPRRAYRSYSYAPTLSAEPATSGSMGGYRSYYRGGGSGYSSGGVRSAGSKILGNYGR